MKNPFISGYVYGYMSKEAGPIGEAIAGIVPNAALSLGAQTFDARNGYRSDPPVMGAANSLAQTGATLGGVLTPTSEKDLKDMNRSPAKGLIPLVANLRYGKRLNATTRRSRQDNGRNNSSVGNIVSELASPLTTIGGAALLGGTIGNFAGTSWDREYKGAMIGGGAAASAVVLAALAALATKRRTRSEQSEVDSKGNVLKNMFIPGAGTYNHYKRVGSTGEQPS